MSLEPMTVQRWIRRKLESYVEDGIGGWLVGVDPMLGEGIYEYKNPWISFTLHERGMTFATQGITPHQWLYTDIQEFEVFAENGGLAKLHYAALSDDEKASGRGTKVQFLVEGQEIQAEWPLEIFFMLSSAIGRVLSCAERAVTTGTLDPW